MKKLTFSGIFLLLSICSTAQIVWVSSHDSTEIFSFRNTISGIDHISLQRVDTTTRFIHNYSPDLQGFYASLGNIGLPLYSLVPSFSIQPGFLFGRKEMADYSFTPENIPYFQSITPFSELRYVMGPDKENVLNALYSRNLYRGLTLGLNYRLIHSSGPYSRQRTDLDNLAITLRYFSKNKHYGALAAIIRNGFDYQLNGGIQNDSVFETHKYTRRLIIPVQLSSANANHTSRIYSFTQYWEPVKILPNFDSIGRDTLFNAMDTSPFKQENRSRFFSYGRFIHQLEYTKTSYTYSDKAPAGFYQNFFRNPNTTFDSISIFQLRNEIAWTNVLYLYRNSFPLRLKFGAEYLVAGYNSYSSRLATFHQLIPGASMRLFLPASIILEGKAWLVIGSYNGGDAGLQGIISKSFIKNKKEWELAGFVNLNTYAADYFYTRYAGNHQQWDTSWSSQHLLNIGGSFRASHTLLQSENFLINNYVYLNTNAYPSQNSEAISLMRVKALQGIQWGRLFVQLEGVWQKPSNTIVLSLPEWMVKATISVSGYLFDNALWAEPGISAIYYSSFYAPAFMPSISSFYLQNEKKLGNFAWADIFFNAKVARARIFLRYRHFHAAWTGSNYWGALHYPLPDAGINFGVIWPFYD